jgi:drug/metabolite transporter (DMT)-like permease
MSERTGTVPFLAAAAAGVTVVLWASAFVGIRAAAEELTGGPLALARLLVALVGLGALLAARPAPFPPRRDLGLLLVCGVAWLGIYNIALNEAERRIDAGTAAMLVNVGPVFVALLAGWLLREGFPRTLLVGCAIAFAGAVIIGASTSEDSLTPSLGALLCVLAALSYAIGVVAQKPLLARTAALPVTFLACAIGAVTCLPFAPKMVDELGDASTGTIAWIVYLGIFPTAIAFTTWAYALARTSAGRMGSTTYLVPPLAVLLGWLLLGEVPPALAIPGGLLCIAGAALARGVTPRALVRRRGRVPA